MGQWKHKRGAMETQAWGNGNTSVGQWKHKRGAMETQAWGSGNTRKLDILQKRALRIINNKGYRSHNDPIFKSEKNIESIRCT